VVAKAGSKVKYVRMVVQAVHSACAARVYLAMQSKMLWRGVRSCSMHG